MVKIAYVARENSTLPYDVNQNGFSLNGQDSHSTLRLGGLTPAHFWRTP